jgi:uncharacterized protein
MNEIKKQFVKWVLITGASSGIGEVFAKRFARNGWNVVLVARSENKLQELGGLLKSQYGVETLVIASDLTQPESPTSIYETIKGRKIELEGLVNNAGSGAAGRFVNVPKERYLSMIDLNVKALVALTHLFLSDMMKRRTGFILNVSSTACNQPIPFLAIYAASKAFVTSFTEALWLEAKGTGVRILNFCPGPTKTPFGVTAGLKDLREMASAETSEQVVDNAMRAIQGNEPTVISGWRNQLLVLLERFFPHRLLLFLVLQFQKTKGYV